MFPDGGYIEGDVFFMSMLHSHLCLDLVGNDVEGLSGYQLKSEFLWLGCGREVMGGDYVGVYEVSSCTGVYECGEGNKVLL